VSIADDEEIFRSERIAAKLRSSKLPDCDRALRQARNPACDADDADWKLTDRERGLGAGGAGLSLDLEI
jgi:hypothetical protein